MLVFEGKKLILEMKKWRDKLQILINYIPVKKHLQFSCALLNFNAHTSRANIKNIVEVAALTFLSIDFELSWEYWGGLDFQAHWKENKN